MTKSHRFGVASAIGGESPDLAHLYWTLGSHACGLATVLPARGGAGAYPQ